MVNDGTVVTGSAPVAEGGGSVAGLDPASARSLTDKIKIGLEMTWQLVVEAYQGRAWVALGHPSWDAYCTREFGTSRLRLPREEREEVVASLAATGMSVRAIASATQLSVGTVQAAKPRAGLEPSAVSTVQNRTVDNDSSDVVDVGTPAVVASLDGKERPAERPTRIDVLKRQAQVSVMAQSGRTQIEIAAELGVSQPTVSADMKAIGQLVSETGVVVDAALLESVTTNGRIDVDRLAEHINVETRPSRDLGRLARSIAADLTGPVSVLVSSVIHDDEWLDPGQRSAACTAVVPALTRVVRSLGQVVTEINPDDVDEPTWIAWTGALTDFTKDVTPITTGDAA